MKFKRIFMLLGLTLSGVSLGSTATNATIAEIGIYRPYGNSVFIRLNLPPSAIPSCSVNGYWHYTLSLDGLAGKEMYAMLISAQASGKQISVTGSGLCSEYGTVESLQGVNILG